MSNDKSLNNINELAVPEWCSEEFLEDILKKKFCKKSIKVNQVSITPGTTKSDHYASVMFRAKIHYTVQESGVKEMQSLIIKTAPTIEGENKDLLEKFVFFETEIKMYTESLPKFEEVLRKNGDNTKLCANIFYHSLKPHKCLIFEDLVELGYTTISERSCNMSEVKRAFLKLAKMHAVSFKLTQEGDTTITTFKDGMLSSEAIFNLQYFNQSLPIFKETLSKHEDLRPYIAHIKKIEENLSHRILESFQAYSKGKRDGIFVLNHGDFHMKNMMIKEKDGKLEDLMLIDFQFSVFASPAIDLIYSYIMLLSPEMRLNNRDELFYYYFTNFQKTLLKLGYKGRIPTMIDFQKELLNHAHYEVFVLCLLLLESYILLDSKGDIGKLMEDRDFRTKMMQREDLINELHELLPLYLKKGYFDI